MSRIMTAADGNGEGDGDGAADSAAAMMPPPSAGEPATSRRKVKKVKYMWVEKKSVLDDDDGELIGPAPLARVGDDGMGGD